MRVAEWNESKYLVLSSCTFLIPCIYAYTQHLYIHSAMIALCTCASINYWRDAVHSYRRNVDVWCSRASLVWGIYDFSKCDIPLLNVGEMVVSIWGSYILSKVLYAKKHPRWVYYHIAFHIITSGHSLYGLYVLKRYK